MDDLTETIASSLSMSYGSHINAPKGGRDWKAAEDLIPVIDAELRKAKAAALREAANDVLASEWWTDGSDNHASKVRSWLRSRAADQNEEAA